MILIRVVKIVKLPENLLDQIELEVLIIKLILTTLISIFMILLAPSINFIPVVLQKLPSKIKPMWFSSNIIDSNHKITILI